MSSDDPTAQALPPAGWYADPEVKGARRYWDGQAWTDQRWQGLATLEGRCVYKEGPEIAGLPSGFAYDMRLDPEALTLSKDKKVLFRLPWTKASNVEVADTSWGRTEERHRIGMRPFGGPVEQLYKRMPVATTQTKTSHVEQGEMTIATEDGTLLFYVPNVEPNMLRVFVGKTKPQWRHDQR